MVMVIVIMMTVVTVAMTSAVSAVPTSRLSGRGGSHANTDCGDRR